MVIAVFPIGNSQSTYIEQSYLLLLHIICSCPTYRYEGSSPIKPIQANYWCDVLVRIFATFVLMSLNLQKGCNQVPRLRVTCQSYFYSLVLIRVKLSPVQFTTEFNSKSWCKGSSLSHGVETRVQIQVIVLHVQFWVQVLFDWLFYNSIWVKSNASHF